jgi:alpha-tubulin suppressor-like RCC1 family protein
VTRWLPTGLLILLGCFGCHQRGEVLGRAANNPDAGPSTRTSDISIGDRHSCAVTDGVLTCWGNNDLGQLGTGDHQARLLAESVAGDGTFRQVTVGASHSCGLDDLGQVYCWGGNERGQLGQGDRAARDTPSLVALPARATRVSGKFSHTCALLIDATLYCWGQNWEGQLGQADQPPSGDQAAGDGLRPLPVGIDDWRAVDTGDGHTCAIRIDGSLWCWGRNSDHELGADSRIQVRAPIQVTGDGPWLTVASGQGYSCAVRQDLSLWCWGQNTGSDSGDGFPLGIGAAAEVSAPTRVGSENDWTAVSANTFHSCALNREERLFCWGRNAEGQLGSGDLVALEEPGEVGEGFSVVSAGRFSTCAATDQGEARCTGENANGQLGTGDQQRRDQLTLVRFGGP